MFVIMSCFLIQSDQTKLPISIPACHVRFTKWLLLNSNRNNEWKWCVDYQHFTFSWISHRSLAQYPSVKVRIIDQKLRCKCAILTVIFIDVSVSLSLNHFHVSFHKLIYKKQSFFKHFCKHFFLNKLEHFFSHF